MKFIFPKNYKFSFKLLGFIDWKTAIFDIIYGVIIFILINFIFDNINIKIYIFISFYFPILLFSFLGINEENIIDISKYLFKYFISQKIILYNKK